MYQYRTRILQIERLYKEVYMADTLPLKKLTAVATTMIADNTEIQQQSDVILPSGTLLYNSDTKELFVSNGVSPVGTIADHAHPHTHAPLIHSHIFGTNQPWLMSNPKLWYREDLQNHPELISLEGQTISDEEATKLSTVYESSTILNSEVNTLTSDGFVNDKFRIRADEFDLTHSPAALSKTTLTTEDIVKVTDQWLVSNKSTNAEHWVEYSFTSPLGYILSEYWLMPAAGTAEELAKPRPTPKSWKVEALPVDSDIWEVIDTQSNIDDWTFLTYNVFNISSAKPYSKVKITITAWNDVGTNLEPGLRRLYVYGRSAGGFKLPDIPAPSADFVWVVPRDNLNTGLKHEDVGDIGITSVFTPLPAYRVAADGSAKLKTDYEELFSVLGYRHDKLSSTNNATTSTTVSISLTSDVLGKYKIDTAGHKKPLSWKVEGSTDGSRFSLIQTVTLLASNFPSDGVFYIDTTADDIAYTTIRFTFTQWDEGDTPAGYNKLYLYTHPKDKFYLPNIPSENETTTYVVARNTADDVSHDVVQRLQQNVVNLANKVTALQAMIEDIIY